MAHGATVIRITLINPQGEEIATKDVPLVVESPKLQQAIEQNTQAIRDLMDLLQLLKG